MLLLGKKMGMTQFMNEDGVISPITVVQMASCEVIKVLTSDMNGYNAIVLGYEDCSPEKCSQPYKGIFEKLSFKTKRFLREIRSQNSQNFTPGMNLGPDIFEIGSKLKIKGKTKGRGFSGTIRRHNFHRGPMSHGSKSHRIPGSIGAGTDPAHVFKGKKMPGQYGNQKRTSFNILLKIDLEQNLMFVKGCIPGKKGALLEIYNS